MPFPNGYNVLMKSGDLHQFESNDAKVLVMLIEHMHNPVPAFDTNMIAFLKNYQDHVDLHLDLYEFHIDISGTLLTAWAHNRFQEFLLYARLQSMVLDVFGFEHGYYPRMCEEQDVSKVVQDLLVHGDMNKLLRRCIQNLMYFTTATQAVGDGINGLQYVVLQTFEENSVGELRGLSVPEVLEKLQQGHGDARRTMENLVLEHIRILSTNC